LVNAPHTAHAHPVSFPFAFPIELSRSPSDRPSAEEEVKPAGVTGCALATGVALPDVLEEDVLLDI